MRSALGLALAYLAATFSAASPARAEPDDEAILRGIQLRLERRDAEALSEFQRAYALRPTPRAKAQIAMAEAALGNWRDAEPDLLAALTYTDDPWVASHLAALESVRRDIGLHLATLEISSNVTATVRIDGVQRDRTPCSLRVTSGTLLVEAEAEGFAPHRQMINVEGGTIARQQIVLVPLAPPPQTRSEDSAAPSPIAPSESTSRTADWHGTWMWIALAGATASLAVGVTANIVRERSVARYNDDATCPRGYKQATCGGEAETANQAGGIAIGAYAGAAALAATGVVLWATSNHPAVVSSWLGPGIFGANIRGHF
jgi:hypothetical protein